MAAYKPSGLIKRIYFKKLTFGDDPFRVEGIRVDKQLQDEVCIEVRAADGHSGGVGGRARVPACAVGCSPLDAG